MSQVASHFAEVISSRDGSLRTIGCNVLDWDADDVQSLRGENSVAFLHG